MILIISTHGHLYFNRKRQIIPNLKNYLTLAEIRISIYKFEKSVGANIKTALLILIQLLCQSECALFFSKTYGITTVQKKMSGNPKDGKNNSRFFLLFILIICIIITAYIVINK
jgi:hypothetical protein